MSAQTVTLLSKSGIFHNLPTFPTPPSNKKYSVIVTGANGISGSAMVDVLAAAPERWGTVWAMSRKPPTVNPNSKKEKSNVKNIAIDFLESTPQEMAETFKKEGLKEVDYAYFASYIQPAPKKGEAIWSNEEEMAELNVKLLSNFLTALDIASIIPKRILMQTGGKHYALHLGPATVPMMEDAPRVDQSLFYYPQEDLLFSWTKAHNSTYTITRPGFILGAVPTASMSVVFALAVYASVQKELGLPLQWPSDVDAWDASKDLSSSRLIAYHAEWALLNEGAADQALNIVDDSRFAWGALWPVAAEWYGIGYETPEEDESKFAVVTMPRSPAPRGFGAPGKVKVLWTFGAWAEREEVKKAWERIQEREGLDKKLSPWKDHKSLLDCFGTMDAEILGPWTRTESMDKSRKLGWSGFVDTKESIRQVIGHLADLKMVPALK